MPPPKGTALGRQHHCSPQPVLLHRLVQQMHPLVPHQVQQITAALSPQWQWPRWNLLCWQHHPVTGPAQVRPAPWETTGPRHPLPLSTAIPLVKAQKPWVPPLQSLARSPRKTSLLQVLLKHLQPSRPLQALRLLWLLPNQPLFLRRAARSGWGHHLQQQVRCAMALSSGGARNKRAGIPGSHFKTFQRVVCARMYDKSVINRVWGQLLVSVLFFIS